MTKIGDTNSIKNNTLKAFVLPAGLEPAGVVKSFPWELGVAINYFSQYAKSAEDYKKTAKTEDEKACLQKAVDYFNAAVETLTIAKDGWKNSTKKTSEIKALAERAFVSAKLGASCIDLTMPPKDRIYDGLVRQAIAYAKKTPMYL